MTSLSCPARPLVAQGERGFTLFELLVSMAIFITLTGAVVSMIDPTYGAFRSQPEAADQQQRVRVVADALEKDLIMAGAGTYSGAIAGTLLNFFAPVQPRRLGAIAQDPANTFFTDRITIVYVPNTSSQTTIRDPMPQPSSEIKVNQEPGCPNSDPLCGFEEGMRCVIFDDTGAYDVFTITQVQSDALHIQHAPPNPDFSKKYSPAENARIAQVETHVYYLDSVLNQLRHYDSWQSDIPVADDIVGTEFSYYIDPRAPLMPKPTLGLANCLYDAGGNKLLPTLSLDSGSLLKVGAAQFTDGPWCGLAPNQFDADLYRLRKIGVRIRAQVGKAELRGTDAAFFQKPGTGTNPAKFVPDFEVAFDVTPRNLNLSR